MNIKKQVCTLHQSKILMELFVPRNSYFAYDGDKFSGADLVSDDGRNYPAFTASELWQMIPTLGFQITKSNNGNGKDYYWTNIKGLELNALTIAELLADILIYTLQTKDVTPKVCMERLSE